MGGPAFTHSGNRLCDVIKPAAKCFAQGIALRRENQTISFTRLTHERHSKPVLELVQVSTDCGMGHVHFARSGTNAAGSPQMLLTSVSAMTAASAPQTFVLVAAMFVPVSLTCLLTWALFGTLLTDLL